MFSVLKCKAKTKWHPSWTYALEWIACATTLDFFNIYISFLGGGMPSFMGNLKIDESYREKTKSMRIYDTLIDRLVCLH